jgi:hypothetical protein
MPRWPLRKPKNWILEIGANFKTHQVVSHKRPYFGGDIPLHRPEMAIDSIDPVSPFLVH